jgi:hypothetical protein
MASLATIVEPVSPLERRSLNRHVGPGKSARGLAQSKTLPRVTTTLELREASWTAAALRRFLADVQNEEFSRSFTPNSSRQKT